MNTQTKLIDRPGFVQVMAGLMYAVKAAFKIVYGHVIHSPLIVSDGYHNLSDLAVTGVVGVVMHVGKKRPSDAFGFGLKEVQTFAAGFIGLALLATVAVLLEQTLAGICPAFDAWTRAAMPWLPAHEQLVLNGASLPIVVAVTCVFIFLSWYVGNWQIRVAKLDGDASQEADGTETKSDGQVEAITLCSLFCPLLGALSPWFAAALSLRVAWVIGCTGWEFVSKAANVFLKGSIGIEHDKAIKNICLDTAGILAATVQTFAVGIEHTAVCLIRITTRESASAKEQITAAIKGEITGYLQGEGFKECFAQITCELPNADEQRLAYAVVRKGKEAIVAPSLNCATHLVVCDRIHGKLTRPKWIEIKTAKDDPVALLATKRVKELYLFLATGEDSWLTNGVVVKKAPDLLLPRKLRIPN